MNQRPPDPLVRLEQRRFSQYEHCSDRLLEIRRHVRVKLVAGIRSMRQFTVTAVLLLQAFLSSAALTAVVQDTADHACPHHSTSRECTMEMCPMNTQHSPGDTSGAIVDCPSNSDLSLLSTQHVHEGPIVPVFDIGFSIGSVQRPGHISFVGRTAPPPVPPPC